MNKIYKVMYSKVKQCAVVVSEIAKSHSHNGESSGVKKHAALTAAVLIALGSFSFTGTPVVQAAESQSVNAGWGISIDKTNGNTISLERNLGKSFAQSDRVFLDCAKTGLVLGTVVTNQYPDINEYLHYGATGSYAVIAGGQDNTAKGNSSSVFGGTRNTASGYASAIFGGSDNRTVEGAGGAAILGGVGNRAESSHSMVAGGAKNVAFYTESSVVGGYSNYGLDYWATSVGGFRNYSAGYYSTVIGGRDNIALLGKNTEEGCNVALGGEGSTVIGNYSTGIAGGSTADGATHALAAGPQSLVTVANGTAIGYQSTADQAGTISFGHDKGDTYYDGTLNYLTVKDGTKNRDVRWPQKAYTKWDRSKGTYVYYDNKNKEITYEEYMSWQNSDGTWNDYYSKPFIPQKQYDSARYNRLVKVADGINDHDVVVMEQLKQYAEKDAGNIGNNLKVEPVYQTDEKGHTIYVYKKDKNGNIIWSESHALIDEEATRKKLADVQNPSKDAWGKALGADTFSEGTPEKATDASTSDQLVTGKTLYNYDAPAAEKGKTLKYVSTNNTTGKNLGILDARVSENANAIIKIQNGGFTDAGKTTICTIAANAVQVKAGDRIKMDEATDEKTGNKTYTISANSNGTVTKDDGNLISGGTLYNEVHADKDGTYIKSKDSATGNDMTVAQNLSALDSGLKTTSDLIHTNTTGDTIQIGGNSTATKIDVNGKDGKGRVITGVVTDDTDPTSAANVGYVNGVTAANTQQIYRDMNNAYGRLNNNINKAAAGSNALAALHPLDYDPDDKADFSVGYGHYRNANAAAVGAFYHPNENTMVNVGVSLGNGDLGFNAGVSFKVGRGGAGREAMSRTEMAKVINSQSKEIDALKKDNADKDKRIDALEQKMTEILAKLDKNGK